MLDIQFIRENASLVQQKADQKQIEVNVADLLKLDTERRELMARLEALRAERNKLVDSLKAGNPTEEQIAQGRAVKEQIGQIEILLEPVSDSFLQLLKSVPNMSMDDVPVGASETENVVIKTVGKLPKFEFEPKNHWQLAEHKGLIDKERASKVAGTRFAYIKGDLVKLHFALMNYAMDVLTSEDTLKQIAKTANLEVSTKPFVLVLPPLMIKTDIYDAMDRLEPRDDRYKIEGEELWLQGSAEHVLGSMHANEIIPETELPIRYAGYATSFRKEAGTYGKDMEGILRMHQFEKLEMESLTTPEDALNEHLFLIAIQEYLMQQLSLPYQVVMKCTADIGKPNARGVDIDVWLPGQNKYRETHTADYMTDYQSRRLQTKFRLGDNSVGLVHTNDATGFSQRPLIAIIENNQNADGSIRVPDVLIPFMGGKQTI